MGVKQQIKQASTEDEVYILLDKVESYKYASEETKRDCRRQANNRVNMLLSK